MRRADGGDEHAAFGERVEPGLWDLGDGEGHDDLGRAFLADGGGGRVAVERSHVGEIREQRPRAGGERGVDLDGDDASARSDDVGGERGAVAGARSELEEHVARRQIGELEREHVGVRRADRGVPAVVERKRHVVGGAPRVFRSHEALARNRYERGREARRHGPDRPLHGLHHGPSRALAGHHDSSKRRSTTCDAARPSRRPTRVYKRGANACTLAPSHLTRFTMPRASSLSIKYSGSQP